MHVSNTYPKIRSLVLPCQVQMIVNLGLALLPGELVHLGHGLAHELAEPAWDDEEFDPEADDADALAIPGGKEEKSICKSLLD